MDPALSAALLAALLTHPAQDAAREFYTQRPRDNNAARAIKVSLPVIDFSSHADEISTLTCALRRNYIWVFPKCEILGHSRKLTANIAC